jgi:hypothetical protein
VDGFQAEHGLPLEIEAGRGARGNAVYRDLIEASLLVDARFLVLAVQASYRHKLHKMLSEVLPVLPNDPTRFEFELFFPGSPASARSSSRRGV